MKQPPLRSCPTCGADYDPEKLGLRDYSWLVDEVPGASDLDFVLEQKLTGRMLVMEFKSAGESLPLGQRLLLKTLVRKGCDVWVVWQQRRGRVHRVTMDGAGRLSPVVSLTREQLSAQVLAWWREGRVEEAA